MNRRAHTPAIVVVFVLYVAMLVSVVTASVGILRTNFSEIDAALFHKEIK